MRQIAFLLVPASVVTAVLAEPITRLVYQRGAFTPGQTPIVAAALAAFAAGLTFNGVTLMLNRAFFSLQSNWLPTAVALANLFLNAVLDVAFSPVGTWGIPLATSLVNIAGAAALFVLLRRKIGRVDFTEVSRTFIRVFAASALAGAAAFAVWAPIDSASGRSLSGQLASVLPALAVAVAVYFAACLALQVREMQTLLSLRGRLRRA